jgi:hypothetical protein
LTILSRKITGTEGEKSSISLEPTWHREEQEA